jgi:nitrous oxidase accessory protein NosD
MWTVLGESTSRRGSEIAYALARSLGIAALLALLASSSCAAQSRRDARAVGCDRFASPRGSDKHSGRRHSPVRTVKRLARTLRRGQTGCLWSGSYRHTNAARIDRPGVTLRTVRRGRAFVDGAIWVDPPAKGARISGIRLTSRDPEFDIPLKVQADDVRIKHNFITGARNTICVLIGSYREARHTVIEGNRIRHCGRYGKYDHLLYLSHTRGAVIRGNVLTSNPGGWAVHLYPDADGTVIDHNVIDRNHGGVVFAGEGDQTSSGNVVRYNAITSSSPRWNIESSWSGSVGSGNAAHHNCLYASRLGGRAGIASQDGFIASRNRVLGRLPYLNSLRGNYRFRRGNRCASIVGDVAGGLRRFRLR